MSIYRGYEIKTWQDGFLWVDQADCDHFAGEPRIPFPTEEAAMDDIDTFKRNSRGRAVQ